MILVTGATGFIGRRVVTLLAKHYKPKEVILVSSLANTSLEKSGRKIADDYGYKVIRADFVTKQGLERLPKSPEIIIHLAANTQTSDNNHSCNDIGTINLYEYLSPLNKNSHFIFVSTIALMSGRSNCAKPITEKSQPAPTDEYGRSKLRAENWLRHRCLKDSVRLTIVRLNTVFGHGDRNDSLFDKLRKLILKKSILVRLNWPGLTSLVHVEDVAQALVMLANRPPKPGKINLYILSSDSLSISQISRLMHQAMGITYDPIVLPKAFWAFCSYSRRFVPYFEYLLSPRIYNQLWRASLIVDDVFYCQTNKVAKILPKWKPRKLNQAINEVVV